MTCAVHFAFLAECSHLDRHGSIKAKSGMPIDWKQQVHVEHTTMFASRNDSVFSEYLSPTRSWIISVPDQLPDVTEHPTQSQPMQHIRSCRLP